MRALLVLWDLIMMNYPLHSNYYSFRVVSFFFKKNCARLILNCRQFSNLANNFLSVAVGYAKIIISEAGLPQRLFFFLFFLFFVVENQRKNFYFFCRLVEEKTIKAVAIGGQAGGEKYIT
jgi:hypothetical protein